MNIIVIGGSLGSIEAMKVILSGLPATYGRSVAVVLHRHADSHGLGALLGRAASLPVCEPDDKQPIEAGHVYIAPPGYHLMVNGSSFALTDDEPVNHARPSIDVLFESAANAYRHRAVGVVLTGANADGANGAARLHQLRAPLIVQDPTTAEAAACPTAALERVPGAIVLPPDEIADRLLSLCGGSRAGENVQPIEAKKGSTHEL